MFYNPVLVYRNIENSLKSCLEKDQFSVYLLGFFPHKLESEEKTEEEVDSRYLKCLLFPHKLLHYRSSFPSLYHE